MAEKNVPLPGWALCRNRKCPRPDTGQQTETLRNLGWNKNENIKINTVWLYSIIHLTVYLLITPPRTLRTKIPKKACFRMIPKKLIYIYALYYLYGCILWSVTVSHQEASPRDRMTLAPPDRKSTHTLSSTVRNDENSVLDRNGQQKKVLMELKVSIIDGQRLA